MDRPERKLLQQVGQDGGQGGDVSKQERTENFHQHEGNELPCHSAHRLFAQAAGYEHGGSRREG